MVDAVQPTAAPSTPALIATTETPRRRGSATAMAMLVVMTLVAGCIPDPLPAPYRPDSPAATIPCMAAINGVQGLWELASGFNRTPEWGNIYGCGHTNQVCSTPGAEQTFIGPIARIEPKPIPLKAKIQTRVYPVDGWDDATGTRVATLVGIAASVTYDRWTIISALVGRPTFKCVKATSYDATNHWNIWLTPEQYMCKDWTAISVIAIPVIYDSAYFKCNASGIAI